MSYEGLGHADSHTNHQQLIIDDNFENNQLGYYFDPCVPNACIVNSRVKSPLGKTVKLEGSIRIK